MMPDPHFHLLDSIGKKIKVAQAVAEAIGLENVSFAHKRAEEEKGQFDFIVSRAVMPLDDLIKLSKKNIKKEQINALPNGLICLKGGELQNEISKYKNKSLIIDLKNYFKEDFFDTKKVVYVPI
jgi:16S rRNA (guanine527-N7)-methyltransferase